MDGKTLAMAGLVVAGPTLFNASKLGRRAGKANLAAAQALAGSQLGFAVPDNASMVDAHAAMSRALAADPSLLQLVLVKNLWLEAWEAGAAADPTNYSLAGTTSADDAINAVDFADLALCDGGDWTTADGATALGRAVCALHKLKFSPLGDDERRVLVLEVTRALAVAMDDADFVVAGSRRSDRATWWTQTGDIPGKLAGKLAGVLGDAVAAALSSPVGLAALVAAGVVLWKVTR